MDNPNSSTYRTHFQDKALNVSPNQFKYSKNQVLDTFYKKAIINTGSIDNGFPFQHSMNKRGKILRDLRPKVHKLY